jgi:methylphosphotriester-DNA--protein-cysteine methyltransferase
MLHPANPPQQILRLVPSAQSLDTAARWQALVNRDASINSFVYAVLTTKIYCRPSCPGRLARRANVRFFDTPAQAEHAGFRACKRCRPQHAGLTAAQSEPQTALVQAACASIRKRLAAGLKPPRLYDLAATAGLTPSHFHRVFKKRVGVTPGQYAADVVQSRVRLGVDGGSSDTLSSARLESLSSLSSSPVPTLDVARDEVDGVRLDWNLEGEKGFGGVSDYFAMVDEAGMWNDFDVLLSDEPAEHIDPRILMGMN